MTQRRPAGLAALVASFMLAIAPIALAQSTGPGPGPCRAGYEFTCDSDGNCTCIKEGTIEVLSYSIGASSPLPVNAGDTVEVLASLLAEEGSTCDVAFVIVAEDVEGEALATLVVNKIRGGLKVAPSASKARIIPFGAGWIRFAVEGEALDCTATEALSTSLTFAVRRGNGTVSSQGTLPLRLEFPNLGGELPPILPADSTVVPDDGIIVEDGTAN